MSIIGRRILTAIFAVLLLSITLTTTAFLWIQTNDNIAVRRSAIQATGFVYASAIAEYVEAKDKTAILKVLRSVTRVPDIGYAVAIDAQGQEIAGLGTSVVLANDLVGANPSTIEILTRGSMPVSVDIMRAGNRVGRLVIIADVSGFRTQLAHAILGTVLIAVIAGAVGMLLAFRLQKTIAGPIISLTGAMSRIRSTRDYQQFITHNSRDETGELVGAFNGMIKEIGARDEKLARLAYFDTLTGLPNRLQLEERIAEMVESAKPCAALILIDIDEFRQVNETFGLSFGDAVLAATGKLIADEVPPDALVARMGADQFAILVPGTNTEIQIQQVLAPVLAAFYRPIAAQERNIYINVSAGVTFMAAGTTTAEEAMRHADLALNSVRHIGIGRVQIYMPSLDKDVQDRTLLAEDLRSAIARNELEVHYQPQVDLRTGTATGFESLLRWKHPARGYVSPGLFVPIAEGSGLICELGLWVLRESCLQARRWMDAGREHEISVNVSLAQIVQSDLQTDVARILRETGLPARLLCLELTESLFAGHSRLRAQSVLQGLHELGVTLAIDDFGTGYSSLAYLRDLPFDKLKIDRAFVTDIDKRPDRRRLFKGILDLAHSLEMTVVAEGAETDGEILQLMALGTESVQGYAMARPQNAEGAARAADQITREFDMRFRDSARKLAAV